MIGTKNNPLKIDIGSINAIITINKTLFTKKDEKKDYAEINGKWFLITKRYYKIVFVPVSKQIGAWYIIQSDNPEIGFTKCKEQRPE